MDPASVTALGAITAAILGISGIGANAQSSKTQALAEQKLGVHISDIVKASAEAEQKAKDAEEALRKVNEEKSNLEKTITELKSTTTDRGSNTDGIPVAAPAGVDLNPSGKMTEPLPPIDPRQAERDFASEMGKAFKKEGNIKTLTKLIQSNPELLKKTWSVSDKGDISIVEEPTLMEKELNAIEQPPLETPTTEQPTVEAPVKGEPPKLFGVSRVLTTLEVFVFCAVLNASNKPQQAGRKARATAHTVIGGKTRRKRRGGATSAEFGTLVSKALYTELTDGPSPAKAFKLFIEEVNEKLNNDSKKIKKTLPVLDAFLWWRYKVSRLPIYSLRMVADAKRLFKSIPDGTKIPEPFLSASSDMKALQVKLLAPEKEEILARAEERRERQRETVEPMPLEPTAEERRERQRVDINKLITKDEQRAKEEEETKFEKENPMMSGIATQGQIEAFATQAQKMRQRTLKGTHRSNTNVRGARRRKNRTARAYPNPRRRVKVNVGGNEPGL